MSPLLYMGKIPFTTSYEMAGEVQVITYRPILQQNSERRSFEQWKLRWKFRKKDVCKVCICTKYRIPCLKRSI